MNTIVHLEGDHAGRQCRRLWWQSRCRRCGVCRF